MSDAACDSHLRAWRDAQPQFAPARAFLRDAERGCFGAYAALAQEWLDAVYAIREPLVAAAKLNWWLDETDAALAGQARHPLTRVLFAQARARAIPAAAWRDALHAALASLEAEPAADFAAQCTQAEPLHGALARIETALWFGTAANPPCARRCAVLGHLTFALACLPVELAHARSPLPMTLLARHGLTRDALAEDSAPRRAAIRDQAAALTQAFDEAGKLAGPLSLFRGVQSRIDRRALQRASRAADPLAVLQARCGGLTLLFDTWRAARAWRFAERG